LLSRWPCLAELQRLNSKGTLEIVRTLSNISRVIHVTRYMIHVPTQSKTLWGATSCFRTKIEANWRPGSQGQRPMVFPAICIQRQALTLAGLRNRNIPVNLRRRVLRATESPHRTDSNFVSNFFTVVTALRPPSYYSEPLVSCEPRPT
jgi:hypothetical protein